MVCLTGCRLFWALVHCPFHCLMRTPQDCVGVHRDLIIQNNGHLSKLRKHIKSAQGLCLTLTAAVTLLFTTCIIAATVQTVCHTLYLCDFEHGLAMRRYSGGVYGELCGCRSPHRMSQGCRHQFHSSARQSDHHSKSLPLQHSVSVWRWALHTSKQVQGPNWSEWKVFFQNANHVWAMAQRRSTIFDLNCSNQVL